MITRPLVALAGALVLSIGVGACGGGDSGSTQSACPATEAVILWGGLQWQELAEGLAAHRAECAEYYLAIPPEDADKTQLRGERTFARVRALDPHIHPVAEIRLTSEAAWREWAIRERRSFYDAGVEARRRMDSAGLDVGAGETWALNELGPDVRAGAPGARKDVLEFLRGLYEGGDLPDARGIVFDLGSLGVTDLSSYKAELEDWLADGEFWAELDGYVDFFAEEVYARPQAWAAPGADVDERAQSLDRFLYHVVTLADAGPDAVEDARGFLERAYVPLANASWPHALIGQTNLVSAEQMATFVSGEVFTMRRREGELADAMGFAWAPNPAEASYSDAGRDLVLGRLASAIQGSAGKDPSGACQGDGKDWCEGELEDGSLDRRWEMFETWGS